MRTAPVVGFRCDGGQITAALVRCVYCRGAHWHRIHPGEIEALRTPWCCGLGAYRIELPDSECRVAARNSVQNDEV